MDPEIKTAIAELGSAWEAFKATNDQTLAEVKKLGATDVVLTEKLDRINGAVDALEDRIGKAEAKANRPRRGADADLDEEAQVKAFNAALAGHQKAHSRPLQQLDADGVRAYKAGFEAFLRKGKEGLEDTERKAMSVGSDPDGGFLVPADMSGRIALRLYDLSPIRQIAAVQPVSTDALEGIADNDQMAAGWVNEQAARPVTTTAQLGKWRIPVNEWYANPDATQKLLDDAVVDVSAWIEAKVAERGARLQGAAFCVGTGVGQPRGFTTHPTAATADGARAWGTLEHINTGVASNFAATNPADQLMDLVESMKDAYRDGARWVTRRSVIALIRKFKDTAGGTYLWQPGLQAGAPPTLIGFPVTKAEDMPALAAGSLSLAFGNFAIGYQVVDRRGMTVLRDPYSNKPYVQFYTTARVGGDVIQFEAIKFIRFGT